LKMSGVTNIVKEKMRSVSRSLSGEFFHVLGENSLIRLRIDETGRVSLDRNLSSLPSQVISTVRERLGATRQKGQRSWRQAVTGSPDTRIRDYIKGVPQVKFIDKLSFMFGVMCIVLTEFLALREPQWFTMFHATIMAFLLAYRFQDYYAQKYHLFMLDFCYFMNLSVIVQTSLYPDNMPWFKANYVLCMGTLMSAIVMWQNSLVFHSLDKLTSFFLHFFPPLHLHLFRWGLIPCSAIKKEDFLDLREGLLLPMLLYAIWQVVYLVITEGLLHKAMEEDPALVTSMRYLAQDTKNPMHQMTKKACRSLGILSREESFDSRTMKTKTIFVVTQIFYTMLTLLPTTLFFSSYRLSFAYFVTLFLWTTWRGGSYYIEVFSERYNLKFVKMELEKSLPEKDEATFGQNSEEDEEGEESHTAAEDQKLINEIMEAIYAAEGATDDKEKKSKEGSESESEENGDDETFVASRETTPESGGSSWEEISTSL